MKYVCALLLLTLTACAHAPRQEDTPHVRIPASEFSTTPWPVVALLDAPTADDKLVVVHEQAEPAFVDAACRLYSMGLRMQTLDLVQGTLGPPPWGCKLDATDQ